MKLIESIEHLELTDNNKYRLEDVENKYRDYINLLDDISANMLDGYLKTLKKREIKNNHITENESSFKIDFYAEMQQEDSLTQLIKMTNEKDKLDICDIKELHKTLMFGTKTEDRAGAFRSPEDDIFVGAVYSDGSKRIDYIPVASETLEENMSKVLELLNSKNNDDIFINPFIMHGLITVLQPFVDGNKRISRLLQHGKIWANTNLVYSKSFELPPIYLSERYLANLGRYRELQNRLAMEENDEAWNKWIEHNLYMLEEQLNALNYEIGGLRLVKKCK